MPQGELKLTQTFQNVTGTLGTQAISDGKLRGDEITFKAGGATYTGKVEGASMKGTSTGTNGTNWSATRK